MADVSTELTVESTPLDSTTLHRALQRIAVQPPYFGLLDIADVGDGAVAATIPLQPPSAPERGVMEGAQIARHLAILGSCAAALARDDDKRHHYLATNAHYMRLAGGPDLVVDETVRAEAVARWIDKRSARAYVKLMTHDGVGLHVLDVHYSVLAPRMFSRLHPPVEVPPAGDPAADLVGFDWPVGAEPVATADGLRLTCGPIPVSVCAGHFPQYPAAPVAIIMGHLCRVAGQLAIQRDGRGEGRYRIEQGVVAASKLAAAGQELTLDTHYVERNGSGHLIVGEAIAGGEVVGTVKVTMSVASS